MRKSPTLTILSWLALLLVGGTVTAQDAQQNPLAVTLEQFVVSETVLEDGTVTEEFAPAELVRPGDVIEYRLTVENAGDEVLPAGTVQLTGPVPPETAYLGGTATATSASVRTEASFDGETFAATPLLVTVTNDDGTEETVEADPATYAVLRWVLLGPLEPGATLTLVYRVMVR